MRAVWMLVTAIILPTAANAVSLGDLIAQNGTVQVGDKVFSGFGGSISTSCTANTSCAPTSLLGVDVQGVVSGDELGLKFTHLGNVIASPIVTCAPFGCFPSGASSAIVTVDIQYHVSVVNSPDLIHAFAMAAQTGSDLFGGGSTTMTTNLYDAANMVLGGGRLLGTGSTDGVLISDQTDIRVVTRVRTEAGTNDVSSSARRVDSLTQTFSQVRSVPEPWTLILMGSGIIGLGIWRMGGNASDMSCR